MRIDEVQTKLNSAIAKDSYINEQVEAPKDKLEEERDLKQIFTVLRKQKQGIDKMVSSVNQSTRQLMLMEREVDIQTGLHGTRPLIERINR